MTLFVAFAIGSYLVGSIPVGVMLGRALKGVDIRDYGSGKTGATNTLRTLGKVPAALAFLGDLLKGILPVLLAKYLSDNAWLQVVAAISAIIGHDFPIWAGFRGGRGVTSSIGATIAMMPLIFPFLLFVTLALLIPFRYVSLASVLGTVFAAILVIALAATHWVPGQYTLWAVVAATLIVVLHRDNIARLIAGTEPKLGQGGSRRGAPSLSK